MCVFAEQFPNLKQEDIAVKYGVERSTVSKVLKVSAFYCRTLPYGTDLRIEQVPLDEHRR
jgi:hypothetical protein